MREITVISPKVFSTLVQVGQEFPHTHPGDHFPEQYFAVNSGILKCWLNNKIYFIFNSP